MKIAFVIFDDFTFLDFIGFYDVVTRLKRMGFLPEMDWDICAMSERISDDKRLCVIADKTNMPLSSYDIVFVPRRMATRTLQNDDEFIHWIQSTKNTPLKISVCTGSLILSAAGFLENKKAPAL